MGNATTIEQTPADEKGNARVREHDSGNNDEYDTHLR